MLIFFNSSIFIMYHIFSEENLHVCDGCKKKNLNECKHSYTNTLHTHKAVNYSLVMIDRYFKVYYEESYTGDNAVDHFLDTLIGLEGEIREYAREEAEMSYTAQDKVIF